MDLSPELVEQRLKALRGQERGLQEQLWMVRGAIAETLHLREILQSEEEDKVVDLHRPG